jgi:hypothetical protein
MISLPTENMAIQFSTWRVFQACISPPFGSTMEEINVNTGLMQLSTNTVIEQLLPKALSI